MLSKDELLKHWGEDPAKVYIIYLPLPSTDYPPSLPQGFGETLPEEVALREYGAEFAVFEDHHPRLKGQSTTWKVVRSEIYPGISDCAYEAIVICHCDRVV